MSSPSDIENLRKTTVADLEKVGFSYCEKPNDYEDTLGGVHLFMKSPANETFIVTRDSAQNLRTDEIIDTKTGQPLARKGLNYSRGFMTPAP